MSWQIHMDDGNKIEITNKEYDKFITAFSKGEVGRPFRVLDSGALIAVSHIVCLRSNITPELIQKESGICTCGETETRIVYKIDTRKRKQFWKQCIKCNKLLRMVSTLSVLDPDTVPQYEDTKED